ncbi:TrbI/VirB10 family protein [Collimonas sp. OK607]|uniref:TrbI/VirB10 family protein n=1 Tax=Collimonas sp. OK607 TaxID=1798194 RepID=UPI00147B8C07
MRPIRSVLLTGVNSNLPGTTRAMITSGVYDDNQAFVVISKGSAMNGRYNNGVIVGQERLLIGMARLVLNDGTWMSSIPIIRPSLAYPLAGAVAVGSSKGLTISPLVSLQDYFLHHRPYKN